jgi:pyridoxamine 5'-phosphate oxidase
MGATGLTTGDFTDAADPIVLFTQWLGEATATEINDANGVALATVDQDGMPDVRMVLLKGFDERGFVFYTNYESAKGQQLLGSMKAALLFHWKSRRRQVRVRGPVEVVTDAEADAYFASRHRQSRLGAIASAQSRPLESRKSLEDAVLKLAERYGDGDIPRPKHWSGFRIMPQSIEFWQDGAFRLHDRIVFARADGGWEKTRLYP